MSTNRKNVLRLAKDKMKNDILNELHTVQSDIAREMMKELEDRNTDLLDSLTEKAHELTAAYNAFGKSKRAKLKASIQWAQDDDGAVVEKPKKPSKQIVDHEALHRVRVTRQNSMKPRASAWLQEGSLVVQRGSQMPLMVLSIRRDGLVEVLAGGQTKYVRDLALRPAYDDDE